MHSGKDAAKEASSPEVADAAASAETEAGAKAVLTPVVTNSITFVTPKPDVTWIEFAFPCYRAAIELQSGASVTAPPYRASPVIEPLLAAAGIDLERGDVAALGGWDCGGAACFHLAARLVKPEKLGELAARIAPEVRQPEPLHWVFEAPGASLKREVHLRAVPIHWGGDVPQDAWAIAMANATHVVFPTVLFEATAIDPLDWLVVGEESTARVVNAEGVLADSHGRCLVGTAGSGAFKPGFELESARFALGTQVAKGDQLARLLGSSKSLDGEFELLLSAPASEAQVQRWIEEGRDFGDDVASRARAQLVGSGEAVEAVFATVGLIASEGFQHRLDGKRLRLSWRTDRIGQAELQPLKAKLQLVVGGEAVR